MRNLIIFSLILNSLLSVAQVEEFGYTEENPQMTGQFIVLKKDSMSISEGYENVVKWININYNTPREVIKGDVKNEYVRIEGYNPKIGEGVFMGSKVVYKGKYFLSFEFKEDKIKMKIDKIQLNNPFDETLGFSEFISNYNRRFKKNGKPKKSAVLFQTSLAKSMNDIKNSFQDFLNKTIKNSINKEDDW